MSARAEQSRRAIEHAALITFCERGYRTTTLEEIGAQVGVTRGTVLHHFKSKAGLLTAIVGPYLDRLADLLASMGTTELAGPAQRRRLVTGLVALVLEHPAVVRLLAADVAARAQVGVVDDWAMPRDRLVMLLRGNPSTARGRLRVATAMGAIVWPLVSGDLELDTATAQAELIGAALAVMERPDTTPADRPSPRRVVSRSVTAAVAR